MGVRIVRCNTLPLLGVQMAKIAKAMGALEVKRLTEPGMHAVGTVAGLRLSIKPSGTQSWILRTPVGTKRSDIGLGAYPAVPLADAWERARHALAEIRNGTNPVAQRKAKQAAVEWTFKTCALAYIRAFEPSWKNVKHGQQWRNTLATYVYPHFGDKHVRDVDTADVTTAIRPLWSTKNETMVRVRNRIELVLSWAAAQGYRPKGFNPATWRGHLDQVLPKPSKVNKRTSFEAMPIDDMHAFIKRLRAVPGMSARCLEFTILCACRSGESRGVTWAEIDLDAGTWSIPATRMKAARPHRIPLERGRTQAAGRPASLRGHRLGVSWPEWQKAAQRHEPDRRHAPHGIDRRSPWIQIDVFRLGGRAHGLPRRGARNGAGARHR